RTPWRDILMSTTLHISGLHHAACILATPGSVRPLTGRHAGSLLIGWLGVNQVGFEPCNSHPLGNNNQFHGLAPSSKVSGLPWRHHGRVRLSTAACGRTPPTRLHDSPACYSRYSTCGCGHGGTRKSNNSRSVQT